MTEDISRRRFLRQASAGTAAVGVIAVGGVETFGLANRASAATDHSTAATSPDVEGVEGPVIAQVTNATTGEISVLVGTREVVYTNKAMAQELMRVAK